MAFLATWRVFSVSDPNEISIDAGGNCSSRHKADSKVVYTQCDYSRFDVASFRQIAQGGLPSGELDRN
jgi:hypothetical protein